MPESWLPVPHYKQERPLVYLNDPWFDVAPQAVPRDAFLAAWVEMDCLSGIIS